MGRPRLHKLHHAISSSAFLLAQQLWISRRLHTNRPSQACFDMIWTVAFGFSLPMFLRIPIGPAVWYLLLT